MGQNIVYVDGNVDRPFDTCLVVDTRDRPSRMIVMRRMRMARSMRVDSGAADNVIPRSMVRGKFHRIRLSPGGSRAGVHDVAADNARIRNEGECDFHFPTKEGQEESVVFKIVEVNKALWVGSYLVDLGHRVIFDKDEQTGFDTSRILYKKTGRIIPMFRERSVWTIDTLIEEDKNADAAFVQQG